MPTHELDAVCQTIGQHSKVRTRLRRRQIRIRRAPSSTATHGQLISAEPLLAGAVEIVVGRDADRGACRNELRQHGMRRRQVLNVERTSCAVQIAVAKPGIAFRIDEVRKHGLPIPTLAAFGRPRVVVGRTTADVHHAVDRTGAAQRPAPWNRNGPTVEMRVRLRAIAPVEPSIPHQADHTDRNPNSWIAIGRSCLHDTHRHARILAQARRQDTACGTPAHDHVVERLAGGHAIGAWREGRCADQAWQAAGRARPLTKPRLTASRGRTRCTQDDSFL